MCQAFISLGRSIFIIIEQVAMLATVDHWHVVKVLALLNVVGAIGDALGGATVSGSIWMNTFRKAFKQNLPPSALPKLHNIYEDLDTQLSYANGTKTRLAIQRSYGYAQTRMLAARTGVMELLFIWTLLVNDINVARTARVEGMVF